MEVVLMFAGQLACEGLNFALKRIIKEERPRGESGPVWNISYNQTLVGYGRHIDPDIVSLEMFGKGYGMPSSHAQFMTFFAVYLSLFLLLRHTPSYASAYPYCDFILRGALTVGLCAGAVAVSASRVYLNYHTPRQVLAGCGAGFVCACGWFVITGLLRRLGWIDWAADMTLSRLLRVRDLLVSEDLAEAGWQRWETLRLKQRVSEARKSD
jgi:dolichyldiphosphatase